MKRLRAFPITFLASKFAYMRKMKPCSAVENRSKVYLRPQRRI